MSKKKTISEILSGKPDPVVSCDYCDKPAKLVSGEEIYPHRQDLWKIWLWSCDPCKAYVGCHGKSKKPKGRLANGQLRRAKMDAHAAFDPYWRKDGKKRQYCYEQLAIKMNMSAEK